MVPTVPLPPGVPATLQVTALSVVFVTVAENVAEFPNNTGMLVGAMLTEIFEGGGGGAAGADPATPPHPIATADNVTT